MHFVQLLKCSINVYGKFIWALLIGVDETWWKEAYKKEKKKKGNNVSFERRFCDIIYSVLHLHVARNLYEHRTHNGF